MKDIIKSSWSKWLAVVAVAGFGAFAGWPYLRASLAVAGDDHRSLTMENVQREVKAAEKEAERERKRAMKERERGARAEAEPKNDRKDEEKRRGGRSPLDETRALAMWGEGSILAGGKDGLFIVAPDGTYHEVDFPGDDVRSIASDAQSWWVGAKDGLWRRDAAGGPWVREYDLEEVRSILLAPGGDVVIAVKKTGLKRRAAEGGDWIVLGGGTEANPMAAEAGEPMP